MMRFSYAHPGAVIIGFIVICVLAAFQVPLIEFDPSGESMTLSHDPSRDIYEDTLRTFGSDKITVVFLRDERLFSPHLLDRLDDLVYNLEELPGVERVESLFSVTRFTSEDGMLDAGPLLDWVPETDEEALEVLRYALSNPMLQDVFVSRNGDATAVNLYLEPHPPDARFFKEFTRRLDDLLEDYKEDFQRIHAMGNPHFMADISRLMVMDQKRIIPLSVLVLLFALMVITRSKSGAALPLLTSGVSILLTLAFMSVAGIPLNMLTIIIPSLILVIGSTEDIHLLSEYMEGLHVEKDRQRAVRFMIRNMGTVIMVTALATFFGFLCITLNRVPILRQFGATAAFGLFVNPIVTAFLAPVYFRFAGPRNTGKGGLKPSAQRGGLVEAMAALVTGWILTRRKTVLAVALGTVGAVTLFSPWVRLNNDILGVFKKDSEIIQRISELGTHLSGVQNFSIRIDSGHEGLFKEPENLAHAARIQDFIKKQGRFDKSLSLADHLRLIHGTMRGAAPTPDGLPESSARVSQYLMLLQAREIERYVSSDFSEINIVVRHNLTSSHEQKKAIRDLEAYIDATLNPHFSYYITGNSILTLLAADSIAEGQAKSVLLLVLTVFIIMSIMFINLKAGLLSLIPNIIPVAFNFGMMGLLGIPLNIGTAMVAAIAIGIAVDDTIHFMTRYNTEMARRKDQDEALRECIKAEMLPAFSSSAALALGFGVLAFSGFVSIIHFGLLSAMVMIVAFLVDMLVTPALLSRTRLLTLWDIMGLRLRKEVVERSEFFRDLRPWQMKKIVLLGRIKEAAAGDILFKEWDQGDSMFLILKGNIQVYGVQEDTGKEVQYNLLLPGDIFGQIAMLEPGPRSANVRAGSEATLVEIDREDFDRLQKMYPRIAAKALRNMARILGHQLVISSWRYKEKERS